MKQVTGEVKGFGNLVQKNSAQIKKMGRQMTVIGGVIVGTIAMMVKAFASFDESMTRSLAIMGNVSAAMREKMAATAKQLSTETTFAAKDLAEAYFFLASAGMSAEASISALAPVARFAQAGAFDLAQATDLLTDAQTALGLSTEDVVQNEKNLIRVSDVLVGANTLANASVLQFSESLTNKAAAALVNLNKEVEEGVAVLAAYADKGVKGRIAGTRLTMMLNGLFAATRENKEAWDAAGISLWEADGSMRSIADIIQDMEGHLGDMTVKQREAELAVLGFNIKTKDSILTLMGSSEKIREWTKNLYDMRGITNEVADKQLKAFNAQLTLLKNTVIGAAISIGQTLAPMLEKLIEQVKKVAARVTAWIKEHPKLTEWIVKLAGAIGTLMVVLGPLVMMLPGLVTGFVLLKAAVISLAGPVGIAAAALVGIALAIKDIIKTHKEAIKAMSDMALGAAIMGNAAENFKKLWITVRKEGGPALEQFNELMKRFGGNWDKILKQIIADPKLAILKAMLLDVAKGVIKVDLEGKNLSITLPAAFQKAGKGLVEPIRTNTEEVVDLISEMADEIYKLTHNEFEVRTRMAEKTYKERKAFLDKEKAADSAYVVAKDAYTAELNQIEKDRTKKFKEEWAEKGRAVTAGLLKWSKEQKKYQTFVAEFTDIIKKHTLSEVDYKIEQNRVWYQTKKKALWDLLGDTQRFYDAMEELDKAYEAKRKGILADATLTWEESFLKILGDAALFTFSLGGLFNQMTENQMANIQKEYDARKAAIENSLMTEKSKTDAMEKLDKEFEKKKIKAQRAAAVRTKAIGIMEVAINTASAIVEALPNIFLAAAVGIMGAAQATLIAAQPLPSFQRGGRLGKGEPGIVGEEGAELFVPDAAGTVVPIREGARGGGIGANITILTEIYMQTIDGATTREFMRREGLQAIVEAIKVGIMKPELQDALRIK